MTDKEPKELKNKHIRLLNFIQEFIREHGYSPSFREMAEKVGISSTSMVKEDLKPLERQGYIEREPHKSRSVRVLKQHPGQIQSTVFTMQRSLQDLLSIPVAGRIVASKPVPVPASDFSYFDAESTVEIALSMLPVRSLNLDQLYALQVQGDSMIDDMVNDGDIVILQSIQEASNGDMVAVWLPDEDETTLKRFYREEDRIRLQPANPAMEPIYITNKRSINIQGKVLLIITPMKTPHA